MTNYVGWARALSLLFTKRRASPFARPMFDAVKLARPSFLPIL
jgi:hypothetical protein